MSGRSRPLVIAAALLLAACAPGGPDVETGPAPAPAARAAAPAPLDGRTGLAQVWCLADGVYSGAAPQGDAAFAALRDLGVRTIVSVDAARPDLERARAAGMRYVHVPLQYSGITAEQQRALAKAVHDLPRPIYVHCHHGRHRAPAAAAVALVATGELPATDAVDLLHAVGTSPAYPGLYRDVAAVRAIDADALTDLDVELVAHAAVRDLAAAMAAIDRTWDHLALLRASGWAAPPGHPDLAPVAEAGILHDQLRAIRATRPGRDGDQDDGAFARLRREAVAQAAALERLLAGAADPAPANDAMERIAATCTACHDAFRNGASRRVSPRGAPRGGPQGRPRSARSGRSSTIVRPDAVPPSAE